MCCRRKCSGDPAASQPSDLFALVFADTYLRPEIDEALHPPVQVLTFPWDGSREGRSSSRKDRRSNSLGERNLIHPDTDLRPVDPRVGMGVVATRAIPKGTITWVRDELDQTVSQKGVGQLHELFRPTFHKYTYVSGTGEYVLCWDHGRFMNHSCDPTCVAPGFDFEIAIRDIEPGEQLTGDYATYNLETGFRCFCGAVKCRGLIEPVDRLKLVDAWDGLVRDAFLLLKTVDQPLWPLVREKAEVEQSLSGLSRVPSCRVHFFEQDDQLCR